MPSSASSGAEELPTDTNPEVQHDAVQLEHLLQVQLQGHTLDTCGHREAASQGHTGDVGRINSQAGHFLLSSPSTELNTIPSSPRAGYRQEFVSRVTPVALTVLGLPPARAAGRGQDVVHAVPVVAVEQPRVTPAAFHAPLQKKGQ